MTDGSLSTVIDNWGSECIGNSGTGSFTQSGGTNSMPMNSSSTTLILGYNPGAVGTYTLSGSGQLFGSFECVGWNGTGNFIQSGGTSTMSNFLSVGSSSPGSNCSYTLSGGMLTVSEGEYVSNFTQSGGTNSTGGLSVGLVNYGTGTGIYTLNGGLLSDGTSIFGSGDAAGIGIFNQSGGTHSLSSTLQLGEGGASSGTYNLSGSGLLTCPGELLGIFGTGNITQSGGTNSVG